jgi:hypothetical protein
MKQERMAARLVYCGAMGYCPVCLGHLLSPVYAVVRCADHARLDLSTLAALPRIFDFGGPCLVGRKPLCHGLTPARRRPMC